MHIRAAIGVYGALGLIEHMEHTELMDHRGVYAAYGAYGVWDAACHTAGAAYKALFWHPLYSCLAL